MESIIIVRGIDGRFAVCCWYERLGHYQPSGLSFLTLADAQHEKEKIERRMAEEQAQRFADRLATDN